MDRNGYGAYVPLLWSVPDLKEFLSGSWKVDRLVIDHARTTIGRLRGKATFRPSGLELIYEERGTLIFGEHRGQAEQTYRYDFPEGDGRALVRFRDGRPFHDLDLSTGQDHPRHACPPDIYEGAFLALGPSAWRIEWKVTGPRKDYDLVTTYTRRASQTA
jgi:uncharacterized protein DUF6314